MKITLFIACMVFVKFADAQIYAEPFTGFSYDIKNNPHFKLFNTGLQCTFSTSRFYEVAVGASLGSGFKNISTDSAFSLNPLLPVSVNARQEKSPSNFVFFVHQRFNVFQFDQTNSLYLTLLMGLSHSKVDVQYFYDKNEYTILNPEQSASEWGLSSGIGLEYLKKFKTNRLLVQMNIGPPPLTKRASKINSYRFMAPLSINVGYSILIKRKTNHQ